MKKTVKNLTALLLATILLFGAAPAGFLSFETQAAETGYQNGDIILFGSYPQSEVTDEDLLTVLNSHSKTWYSYGYYSGDGNRGSMTSSSFMKYADVEYDGEKYRAVKFTSYRPNRTYNISSASTSNQDNNGYIVNNVYWFRYDPIKWEILNSSTGLVVSETIIDAQPFNNTIYDNNFYYTDTSYTTYANNYAESTIREWLNYDFYYTAFYDTDTTSIKTSTLTNEAYDTSYSKYDSETTKDKIFLLSYSQANNSDYFEYGMLSWGSQYALCQGLPETNLLYSSWTLRSAGYSSASVCYVNADNGELKVSLSTSYINGIRPALMIDLASDEVMPASGQCGDEVYWEFSETERLIDIYGSGDMWDYEDSFTDCEKITPWFALKDLIESAIINLNVTSIGDCAFAYCHKLSYVGIMESDDADKNLERIGDCAFFCCYELESIEIPDTVREIDADAFYSSGLIDIDIPSNVHYIGKHAFTDCPYLQEITVDTRNSQYSSLNGVLFNKNKTELIQYPSGNERTSYTVSSIVKTIGDSSFSSSLNLITVSGMSKVETIDSYAFENCNYLENVYLPKSVSVHYAAFRGCSSLANVYYNGTKSDWSDLYIEDENDDLLNAEIIETFTLIYNTNGGTGTPARQSGSTITLRSNFPERFGYTFLGWSKSSSAISATYIPGNTIKLTEDTTLYAVWKAASTMSLNTSYTASINFDDKEVYYTFTPSSSGTYTFESTGSLDSKIYVYNSSETELGNDDNDSDEGKNFKLSLSLSSGTKYYIKITAFGSNTGSTSFKVTKDVPLTYTVSYNANGGSGAPSAQIKTEDVSLVLSNTIPTKSYTVSFNANDGFVSTSSKTVSCTFINWNTSPNGSGTSYQPGADYTANSGATLYAQWSNPSYGTLPTPTRSGYTFNGWYTSSTGVTKITHGSTITGNTTVYAQWTPIPTYTLHYNANGGSGVPSDQTQYETEFTVSTAVPVKFGYTFNGWSTRNSATYTNYVPGEKINLTENTTLYAVWQPATAISLNTSYTAYINFGNKEIYYKFIPTSSGSYTFESTGSLDSKIYVYGSSGYEYGYDDNSSSEGNNFKLSLSLTSGTTYYFKIKACNSNTGSTSFKVTKDAYTLTYNANGGSGAPSSQTGTTLTISSVIPERDGYSFLGWSFYKSAYSASYRSGDRITITSDTTLYAVWKAEPVSCSILTPPTKTSYYYTESTDASGLTLEIMYADGSSKKISDISQMHFENFDTYTTGRRDVTVTCGGVSTTFEISVKYTWWQWIIVILLFGWIWY